MELHSVFVTLSLMALVISFILIIVEGFEVSVPWGLANLFLSPFSTIVFIFMYWKKAKAPLLLP